MAKTITKKDGIATVKETKEVSEVYNIKDLKEEVKGLKAQWLKKKQLLNEIKQS